MGLRVQLADGRVVTVETDDPEVAARAAHRYQQENPAPQQYGSWRPRGVGDLVREGPSEEYRQAYNRRRDERAPGPRPNDIPVPDWLQPVARGLEAFNRQGPPAMFDQMWRNVGVADDVAEIGARLRGGSEEQARAAGDYERDQQQRVAREQPILNTASIVSSIPAMAGNPAGIPGRIGMLQAGTAAAGVNAPFALARQEGSLQERAPGALRESLAVFGGGAALQGLANRLSRPALPQRSTGRVQEFEQAGVRAPLAAVQGRGSAPLMMAIAENPIGGNVRRNLQNSADDVAQAARNLTQRAGPAEPREIAGEIVQRGVRRFARGREVPQPAGTRDPRSVPVRDWTFGAKAEALYDDVFSRLARDEAAMIGQVDGPLLDLSATMRTLDDIERAVHGPASRAMMESGEIARMRQALNSDQALGELRFQDLRRWRTWVREAQRNEGLRQGIGNANLQRLESALTEDIYTSAMNIGGQAARDLRMTDRWYRTINHRIRTALEPFAEGGGSRAFQRIIDLAREGGRQNTRQLAQLRASLRPDEWRVVQASVLDELGNPTAGAANAMEPGAFSLERFVTNVASMSPSGRQLLFGELAPDLERLARVAGSLKQVRGFTNYSRSGSSLQNSGSLLAAGGAMASAVGGNVTPLALLAGAGLTARITGEMLSNPAFVRWLTRSGASGQGMRRQLAALATIAARDPAIAPLHAELAQRVGEHFQPGEGQRPAPVGSPERQLEAAP